MTSPMTERSSASSLSRCQWRELTFSSTLRCWEKGKWPSHNSTLSSKVSQKHQESESNSVEVTSDGRRQSVYPGNTSSHFVPGKPEIFPSLLKQWTPSRLADFLTLYIQLEHPNVKQLLHRSRTKGPTRPALISVA